MCWLSPQHLISSIGVSYTRDTGFACPAEVWYTGYMDCNHAYEVDLDGLVICSACKHVVDEVIVDPNKDFWETQMSFEEQQ